MKIVAKARKPNLEELYALFPPAGDIPDFDIIPGEQVPPPYHGLLVHQHHMTVTVEKYYGDLVDVRILARRQEKDWYARKILLTLQKTGRVVQFGIMKSHLSFCSQAVRDEIVAGKTPLGRTLIQHKVLRRIEPRAYLRIQPDSALMRWFGMKRSQPVYGRLAIIHCNGKPAVELLEVLAPE